MQLTGSYTAFMILILGGLPRGFHHQLASEKFPGFASCKVAFPFGWILLRSGQIQRTFVLDID